MLIAGTLHNWDLVRRPHLNPPFVHPLISAQKSRGRCRLCSCFHSSFHPCFLVSVDPNPTPPCLPPSRFPPSLCITLQCYPPHSESCQLAYGGRKGKPSQPPSWCFTFPLKTKDCGQKRAAAAAFIPFSSRRSPLTAATRSGSPSSFTSSSSGCCFQKPAAAAERLPLPLPLSSPPLSATPLPSLLAVHAWCSFWLKDEEKKNIWHFFFLTLSIFFY